MGQGAEVPQSNVVPLRPVPEVSRAGGLWPQVQLQLRDSYPAQFATWFSKLEEVDLEGGCLTLAALSAFVAATVMRDFEGLLVSAARQVEPSIHRVVLQKP